MLLLEIMDDFDLVLDAGLDQANLFDDLLVPDLAGVSWISHVVDDHAHVILGRL